MWQGESRRNTQFGTNCGRLPAAFPLQPSKAPFAAVPTLRFFVSGNSLGVEMPD
ncbi:hypothetical protein ABG870_03160 [Phocaeicola vulgatus]